MLRTVTVDTDTLVLLKNLQQLPLLSGLRLVGGTALALQIGHRKSVDLDFFGKIEEDGITIAEMLKDDFEVILESESPRIHIFKINGIKVDMVNYPFQWLEPALETEGIKMANIKDIAAMKIEAVTNRGTKKDFVDVYFLLKRFPIQQLLAFYGQKFPNGSAFNVIRSLSYFEDAEVQAMPEMLVPTDWEEIKARIGIAIRNI